MTNVESSSSPIQISSKTAIVDDRDACLHWLNAKYPSVSKSTTGEDLLSKMENDVRACNALRWSRFAFPSEPHQPLRSNYNNENGRADVVVAKISESSSSSSSSSVSHGGIQIDLHDQHSKKSTKAIVSSFETEPSRHVFRELARRDTLADNYSDGARRPDFGGYVVSPQQNNDSARFLVFPQWGHHNNCGGSSHKNVLQEVGFYLRGTMRILQDKPAASPDTEAAFCRSNASTSLTDRFTEALRLNIFFSKKYASRERCSSAATSWWLPRWPAVLDVETHINQQRTERRYAPGDSKVKRLQLAQDGIAITAHKENPRLSTKVASFVAATGQQRGGASSCAHQQHGSGSGSIFHLSVHDQYQSTTQKWASGQYQLECAAGPGVEYHAGEDVVSIFAKFASHAWVEWPLWSRFQLKLRHSSAVLVPYDPSAAQMPTVPDFEPIPAGRSSHDNIIQNNSNSPDSASSVIGATSLWDKVGEHAMLWATQGPKWDPKLVRGFDNDYSELHHAKRWYALFSAELSRAPVKKIVKKPRGGGGGDQQLPAAASSVGMFAHTRMNAFANMCFVDSVRQYPRASVGISMTSEIPRVTVDAFNKIIPRKFECNFSWFVSFREGALRSGLEPGKPEALQYMRVSPVETFRHMRCGLTWNF